MGWIEEVRVGSGGGGLVKRRQWEAVSAEGWEGEFSLREGGESSSERK